MIDRKAFIYCSNLTKVFISDSVEVIEEFAFEDCPKLQEASIPKHLEEDAWAFFPEHTKVIIRPAL